jgi:Calcineurin-like phosphoesterase
MAARIEALPATETVRFAFAGDSGAWPDPTADAIFSQLVLQVAALEPEPTFFANLGDFAGPGTLERHEHYLRLVEPVEIPNVCIVGNHDLDDAGRWETFLCVHGAMNFTFACSHTRFVAIHAQASEVGEVDIDADAPDGIPGPREEDLAFLDESLRAAAEPNRVVLMHMPPNMDGHYAPRADWGFTQREDEFSSLLHEYRVKLVCCAHGLAFDEYVHGGVRVVMSGGGGTGLDSTFRGISAQGEGHPEDRGSLFHAVEIAIDVSGAVSGRVLQAFDAPNAPGRIRFGD